MSQVPFPSRTSTVGSFLAVSGGGSVTVFSGQGVCLGVLAYPLSGSAVTASFSGVGRLIVQDATSGMVTLGSGVNVIYVFDFAAQSGLSNGQNSAVAALASANLPYTEFFCNSGLVAATVSGWGLTVLYNK